MMISETLLKICEWHDRAIIKSQNMDWPHAIRRMHYNDAMDAEATYFETYGEAMPCTMTIQWKN